MARLLSVNVGLPRDIAWARKDRPHRHLEGTGSRPAHGTAAQYRRRWARETWLDTAASTGPSSSIRSNSYHYWQSELASKRLHLWAVRRELHGRRPVRPGGVHWRSLPDRQRFVRSDTAARHLLPGGHPHERAADGRAAGRARQTRFLLPRSGGRRGGSRRRDRSGRGRSRAHDRLRDQCVAIHARSPSQPARARAAHPGAERRLARLLPGAARAGAKWRHDDRKRGARSGVRPASGMGGVPPAAGVAQGSREQQRHLAGARAHGWASSDRSSARPVCRAAAKAGARCARADAQLFVVGRTQCRALSRERQAGSRMGRPAPTSTKSYRLATCST